MFSPWKLAITENTFGASYQPYRTSVGLPELSDEFDSFARARIINFLSFSKQNNLINK